MKTTHKITFLFVSLLIVSAYIVQKVSPPSVSVELVSQTTQIYLDSSLGVFKFQIKVTASGGDILMGERDGFVAKAYLRDKHVTEGVDHVITPITRDSGPNGQFKIHDGETVVFEITTAVEPRVSGLYRVNLEEMNWYSDDSSKSKKEVLDRNFKTPYIGLVAVPSS